MKISKRLLLFSILISSVLVSKDTFVSEKVVEAAEYKNGIFYGDDGKPANWWYNDGKEWYFFQNGKKYNGYGKDASGKKFFDNGKYANWWNDDGKEWYFFQKGEKHSGYGEDASGKKFFDNGKYASWWHDDGKDWYFFQNGKKHNGYGKDASGKKFFDNGKYANWWYDDGENWYFFQNGKKFTGTAKDGSGIRDFINGKYSKEIKNEYKNGLFYDENGDLANWWCEVGKEWYFFQNGKKHSGYGKDASGKKYFDNGKYADGWYDNGEDWYFFQEGKKHSGYGIDGNGKKYFDNGKYANWWHDDGEDWYYFKDGDKHSGYGIDASGKKFFDNGEYANGWYDNGEDWYFFQKGEKFTGRARDESGYRYFVNGKYGKSPSQSEFINKITPGVLKAIKGKGLFPSIAVAQACLETGYGNDSLSPPPIYNLFGIKASKDTPPSRYYEMRTAEYKNGKKYYITAKFMKFSGYDEAFEYYAKLFTKNNWLRKYYAGVLAAKTPEEAAEALTGTYATDPNYGKKLLDIIDKHGLRELDKEIFPNGVKP